jgi:hypothetical protein
MQTDGVASQSQFEDEIVSESDAFHVMTGV